MHMYSPADAKTVSVKRKREEEDEDETEDTQKKVRTEQEEEGTVKTFVMHKTHSIHAYTIRQPTYIWIYIRVIC